MPRRHVRVGAAVALVFAGTLTWATTARAYRPFDGTDADVAHVGEVEVEIGPLGYVRSSSDAVLIAPNVIFNLGTLPRWELVLEGSGALDRGTPSFIDGGVFAKHVLREGTLQGKSGTSVALETGLLIPTLGASLPVNDFGVYVGFIASYAWPHLAVHLNTWLSRAVDEKPDVFVGAIVEGTARGRIRPVTEVYVERHGALTTPSVLVGFIARASRHLSFDAATRLAWTNEAPMFEARAGFTWTFRVW